jgi:hypothetical protein
MITAFILKKGISNDLINLLTKRRKRKAHQFEMLTGEWKTDDAYGQKYTKDQMGKCDPDTSQQDPENIEYSGKTTRTSWHFSDMTPEREQGKNPDLEALYPKRNTNDGQAKRQSRDHVLNKNEKSSKYQPDDVTK